MANRGLDKIGYWSEIKLEIVRKYANAYSKILSAQRFIRGHAYIDGFAGAGVHISRTTGDLVAGSPLNALQVQPPFSDYYLIDMDGHRANQLREMAGHRKDVHVFEGNANEILINEVFPRCRKEDYRRALCLLDPYGLDVDWAVLEAAGRSESIEIFFNFMIMDANMNVLHREPDKATPEQRARMDAAWGAAPPHWREVAYPPEEDLFGRFEKKGDNHVIAMALRQRLIDVAKFKFVPEPMPMRNSNGATIYYLFFAGPNETGARIVKDIFTTYRDRKDS